MKFCMKISTFFFLESAWGVGPRGPQGPQVRAPDLRGPGPFWGPWGPYFFGALRAQGPSGALEPGPWGPSAILQIKDPGLLEALF